MMEEQRITDRHIQETSERAKAKLDVQQTQQVRVSPPPPPPLSLSFPSLWSIELPDDDVTCLLPLLFVSLSV